MKSRMYVCACTHTWRQEDKAGISSLLPRWINQVSTRLGDKGLNPLNC